MIESDEQNYTIIENEIKKNFLEREMDFTFQEEEFILKIGIWNIENFNELILIELQKDQILQLR
jgi:hypothetical protein